MISHNESARLEKSWISARIRMLLFTRVLANLAVFLPKIRRQRIMVGAVFVRVTLLRSFTAKDNGHDRLGYSSKRSRM